MRAFDIITDSSCDLSDAMAKKLELEVVPLNLQIGDKSYKNRLDERDISIREVYRILRTDAKVATSAPNVQEYIDAIEPRLSAGRDALILSFSSALSSTYANSELAVKELEAKYPERRVLVVDTKCASLGQGLLVYTCANMANEGKSIDEVYEFAVRRRGNVCHWFTLDNFHRLKLGGRISAATALVGALIGVKPVLHVDDEGRLVSVSKTRGRANAISALVERLAGSIIEPEKQTIFISHGDCEQDALTLREKVKERVKVKDFVINTVGPVIGAHSGAGTLAMFWYGSKR